MLKTVSLNHTTLSSLGVSVEIRELTVGQWLSIQAGTDPMSDQERSFKLLSLMLYVDGEPIGWERLLKLGMNEISPALPYMTAMLNEGDAGNG